MNTLVKNELDELATALREAVRQSDETKDQMFDNWLLEGRLLLTAKEHFKSLQSFGHWLDENGILIGKNERIALMAFASEPERARLVFGKTHSQSAQLIYTKEFRFPNARKTEKVPAGKGLFTAPKLQKTLDAYDEFKAAGVEPTQGQLMEKAGVSATIVQKAVERRLTEAELAKQEPDLAGMPKSWALKYEAAVRRKVAQLEAEYNQRRMAEIERHINEYLLPRYHERLERAERIMAVGRKPFTVDEYRKLLSALHPDSSVERRTEMFRIVKEREDLLRPPERDKPLTSSLPQTLEELLKRRKKR